MGFVYETCITKLRDQRLTCKSHLTFVVSNGEAVWYRLRNVTEVLPCRFFFFKNLPVKERFAVINKKLLILCFMNLSCMLHVVNSSGAHAQSLLT